MTKSGMYLANPDLHFFYLLAKTLLQILRLDLDYIAHTFMKYEVIQSKSEAQFCQDGKNFGN